MKRALLAFIIAPVITGACFMNGPGNNNGSPDAGSGDGSTVLPFSADPPSVYVSKVKNLLTGLPALQSDVDTVANAGDDAAKQAALKGLIDQWMGTPQYTQKMITFFELAFQQTQITSADFVPLVPNQGSVGSSAQTLLLLQNVREMFARTVLELIREGKPLSTAFTTNTFMMTPPLMEMVAFMDQNQVDDNDNVVDMWAKANPTQNITVQSTNSAITFADSITAGTSFMNFYFPGLTTAQPTEPSPTCQAATRTYPPSAHTIHFLLYGQLDVYRSGGTRCNIYSGNTNSQFSTADFSETAWKMVTVRQPTSSSEPTTTFFDLPTLRGTSTLVLNTPRVGFYSTPAFQANWPTNTSNVMRVTMNQAFIVALGAQVDGTDTTPSSLIGSNPPGLDQKHASAGQACLGCHQILDPSKSILNATYSYGYGMQTTSTLKSQLGEFIFNGTVAPVSKIGDLGAQLAQHVFYPGAWVQKLCFYANSQACDPADPAYQAIVTDFQKTGTWKTLIEDVMSSPITTNALSTMTNSTQFQLDSTQFGGELVSVSRRDHLCTLLNARLNLTDVCGLDVVRSGTPAGIPEIAQGLPSDGYGRGAPIPVLPAQPTLFFRAGLENICEDVANMIIDNTAPPTGAKTYSSSSQANVDAAIGDFVNNLMGIVPNDPASAEMNTLLHGVYTGTLAVTGVTPAPTKTDALRSTFITACESPNVAAIGM